MSVIKISACDNEIILVGSAYTDSYQICDIKSGNNQRVDVTINLEYGETFSGTLNLNGVNAPLSGTYTVTIPFQTINLGILGLDWGVAASFAVDVDGTSYSYSKNPSGPMVWAGGDPIDGLGSGAIELKLGK